MKNIFNKSQVAYGVYMIVKDNQRYCERDKKYFISCNIPIVLDVYTLCGTGDSGFVSYAVLDRYGVMIKGGMVTEKTVVDTSSKEAKYIALCGFIKDLDTLMALDSGDVPPDQPYIPGQSGGGGEPTIIYKEGDAVLLATECNFNEVENNFIVSRVSSSTYTTYDSLPENFTLYLSGLDFIPVDATVELFGARYIIKQVDGSALPKKLEGVPDVLPILIEKSKNIGRILYSLDATSSGAMGFEDMIFQIED